MTLTEQEIVRRETAGVLLLGYTKTLEIYKQHLEKTVPKEDKEVTAWQAAARSLLSHMAALLKLMDALNKEGSKTKSIAENSGMEAAYAEISALESAGEYELIGHEEFV